MVPRPLAPAMRSRTCADGIQPSVCNGVESTSCGRWFIKVRESITMPFHVKLSFRLQSHHYLSQRVKKNSICLLQYGIR